MTVGGLTNQWTGLKTWAAPPSNSASTSTYRWTVINSNKQTIWDNHQWLIVPKAGEWSTQQSASPSGRTDVTLPSPGCQIVIFNIITITILQNWFIILLTIPEPKPNFRSGTQTEALLWSSVTTTCRESLLRQVNPPAWSTFQKMKYAC